MKVSQLATLIALLGLLIGCGKPSGSSPAAPNPPPSGTKSGKVALKARVVQSNFSSGENGVRIYNEDSFEWTSVSVTLNDEYRLSNTKNYSLGAGQQFHSFLKTFRNAEGVSFGHSNFRGIKKITIVSAEGQWSGKLSQ